MRKWINRGGHGTFEAFVGVARRFPQKPAMIYLGERYSFKVLLDMVGQVAGAFSRMGVGKGDRVILYLYNMPQTIVVWLALQRLGAVPVMIAPVYTSYDVKYMANDVEAHVILCMDTNVTYVVDVLSETSIRKVVVTTLVDLLPRRKGVIGKAFRRIPSGRTPKGTEFVPFRDLLKGGSFS